MHHQTLLCSRHCLPPTHCPYTHGLCTYLHTTRCPSHGLHPNTQSYTHGLCTTTPQHMFHTWPASKHTLACPVPQTEEARAEALTLMSSVRNLCTPKNGEIMIAATQVGGGSSCRGRKDWAGVTRACPVHSNHTAASLGCPHRCLVGQLPSQTHTLGRWLPCRSMFGNTPGLPHSPFSLPPLRLPLHSSTCTPT